MPTLSRTSAATRLGLRIVPAGALLLGSVYLLSAGADASPSTPNPATDLLAGDEGFYAGTFTLARSTISNVDTVTGVVHITTGEGTAFTGAEEVSLCLSATPFEDRIYAYLENGCIHVATADDAANPNKHNPAGQPKTSTLPSAVTDYQISAPVPASLAGKTVHVQLHARVYDAVSSTNLKTPQWRNGYAGFVPPTIIDGDETKDQHGDIALEPEAVESTTSSTSSTSTTSTTVSSTTSSTTATTVATTTTTTAATTTTTDPAEVLGTNVTQSTSSGVSGSLPRTGTSSILPLAMAGAGVSLLGLSFLGLGAEASTRRRRRGGRRTGPAHLRR